MQERDLTCLERLLAEDFVREYVSAEDKAVPLPSDKHDFLEACETIFYKAEHDGYVYYLSSAPTVSSEKGLWQVDDLVMTWQSVFKNSAGEVTPNSIHRQVKIWLLSEDSGDLKITKLAEYIN